MQEFYDCPKPFSDWLESQWSIKLERVRRDISIEGSPERTLSREVIEDKNGQLLLLEKFGKNRYALRHQVAQTVNYINSNGLLQAAAYKKAVNGEFLPFFKGACFQISKFHTSTAIERPQYLQSRDIGDSFARFVIRLRKTSKGIGNVITPEPFSIKKYIYTLFRQMKDHNPDVHELFLPVLSFLEKSFMDVHDDLPIAFCHGDLHPLNVIWDDFRIKAVIDWEFAGFKPDVYDAANLVGCAGIENPEGLGQPMVMTFLDKLKKDCFFSKKGWHYFCEYLIALRFAWLSEWLRKKDTQMIEMEAAFLKLLIDNIDLLKTGWGIE